MCAGNTELCEKNQRGAEVTMQGGHDLLRPIFFLLGPVRLRPSPTWDDLLFYLGPCLGQAYPQTWLIMWMLHLNLLKVERREFGCLGFRIWDTPQVGFGTHPKLAWPKSV